MKALETYTDAREDAAFAARDEAAWRNSLVGQVVLVGAVIAAAALRFVALGKQPLWLDEATDAAFAARSLVGCIFAEAVHPPLYRVLLHFVVAALGTSNFAMRLLPALFGVLAVPALALLAAELFPEARIAAARITVALFAASSPFLIYYSQECRNYSLFILLSIVSTWVLLRFGRTGRGLLAYVALSALLIYTHYLAAFVLLAHEIVYWRHWRVRMRGWIIGRAAVAAAFAPWLLWAAAHYENQSRLFLWPGLLVPAALLRFLMGYGVDAPDAARNAAGLWAKLREQAPVVLPAFGVYGWILWMGIRRSLRSLEARTLLGAILLLPWAVLLLLAPWVELSQERYLAFQAPFVLLLLAAGICAMRGRTRIVAGACVAATIAFSLAAYYGAPGSLLGYRLCYAKEDWAGAAAFVRDADADAVVLAPDYLRLPLNRYALDGAREFQVPPSSSALPDLGGARRTALVLSHEGEPQERLRESMDATWPRVAEQEFTSQNRIRVIVYDTSSGGRKANQAHR